MAYKPRSTRAWPLRVLGKWIWVLGLTPLLLDYVTTYLPRNAIPAPLSQLIETGAPWQLSLVLLTLGLLLSAYLVHRETILDGAALARELEALTETQPRLAVALRSKEGGAGHVVTIPLMPTSLPPDFDALVDQKKTELLSRAPSRDLSDLPEHLGALASLALASAFSEPNPRFMEEVADYLPRYRQFLIEKYEVRIPRAFAICPIITNAGPTTATSVILELEMPASYAPPRPHQDAQLQGFHEDLLDIIPRKPPEPKPRFDRYDQGFPFHGIDTLMDKGLPAPPDPNEPEIAQREGRWSITYHIPQIVPQRTYADLNPFHIWAGPLTPPVKWELAATVFCSELPSPFRSILELHFTPGGTTEGTAA